MRRMVYDAAGQQTLFTEVSKSGTAIASQSWSFDVGGRAVKRIKNPAAAAFTAPTYAATYLADNRLNTLKPGGGGAAKVAFDPDGNITNVSLWEPTRSWQAGIPIRWDPRNRLTHMQLSLDYLTYQYDAEGNLISRSHRNRSSQFNRYTVNPTKLSQQLIDHRPDGSKVFYVYGSGLLYEETFNASSVSQGTRSYHYDQVGSTIALSNDLGTVTGRLEYTAYGVTSFTSGIVDTKFRYNGQYGVQTDLTSGLLQMRARWYSPSLGRFLSEDPIGFNGGMNWYTYAGADPISKCDPFGLAEFGFGVAATAAAVGGATGGYGLYGSNSKSKYWYDNIGLYGTVGGVIGFEVGAAGTFAMYQDGGMRGSSTGIDIGVGPGGGALYKSSDTNTEPFQDAAKLLREFADVDSKGSASGFCLSVGSGAPVALSVVTTQTGVVTLGDVGRGFKRAVDSAWNGVFGVPATPVGVLQNNTGLGYKKSGK